MWLALPPVNAWPLAWIAPVPWLLLVRQKQLLGKRPYLTIWLAGFVFWLAAVHWIVMPHPVLILGLLALAFYLGLYVPVFVGLCRVAVHQLRISLLIAAPIIWMGLELAKGHFLSGFTMGSLGHTQVHFTPLIQIADIFGSYGVSAFVIFIAACVARMIAWDAAPRRVWPIAPLVIVMAMVIFYGILSNYPNNRGRMGPRIALIQGSFAVEVKHDPEMAGKVIASYTQLSIDAIKKAQSGSSDVSAGPPDLIVWPETMYRYPLVEFSEDAPDPTGRNGEKMTKEAYADRFRRPLFKLRTDLGVPLLLGIDRVRGLKDGEEHYNSAVFIPSEGEISGHYDKVHLVAFGEYVPFAVWFPWLYKLTPLPQGAHPGDGPKSFKVGEFRIAPSICYETTIPHLIRGQVAQLREQGEEPDILVNITNDGWFRGSSELDMHLACAVFRAIECRKPMLIAANTGFSAWIDDRGKIVRQGERWVEDKIIAEPYLYSRPSLYLTIGDWPAGICLLFCGLLVLVGWQKGRAQPKMIPPN